jgi:RNA polymerase sigma-70 factor (ECF subfamily)
MDSIVPDRGDCNREKEFIRFFQQYDRKLYGYILSLVPNMAAADEISQETGLRLWEQFDRFDPNTDFLAWACSIAYYQVLTYRNTSHRQPVRFDSKLLELLANRAAERHEELAAKQGYLIDCLTQLSDFKRQVIQLYYCLGMTAKAVAERLGRNVAAVEKTLVRTRRTLHDCVETAVRREEHA